MRVYVVLGTTFYESYVLSAFYRSSRPLFRLSSLACCMNVQPKAFLIAHSRIGYKIIFQATMDVWISVGIFLLFGRTERNMLRHDTFNPGRAWPNPLFHVNSSYHHQLIQHTKNHCHNYHIISSTIYHLPSSAYFLPFSSLFSFPPSSSFFTLWSTNKK